MTAGRRLGPAAIACGLAIALLSQRSTPIASPPLYDGVLVIQPYQWLSPPPGLQGGAQPVQNTDAVTPGQAGGLAIGTPEQPSQVQLTISFSDLVLPPGTTSINVSIVPVAAPLVQPPNGIVAGNAYQIAVTDEHGAAISIRTGGGTTLVMRSPASLPNGTVERFSDGAWTQLQTAPAGLPDTFYATAQSFSVFALVAPYAWVPSGETSRENPSPQVGSGSGGSGRSSGPVASTAPIDSRGGGIPWVPIAGEIVSFLVLVGAGLVLWRLGRHTTPADPGVETDKPHKPD